MRQITVLNRTKDKIVVQYDERQCIVDAKCQETIQIDDNGRLRIYKQGFSYRLCLGQIFLRGFVKNMWALGPVMFLNYDSFLSPPKGIGQIEVTETGKKRFLFFIYNLLLFNSKQADEYDYHDVRCKRRVKRYIFLFIIPFFIISFLLILVTLYGMVYDLSFESIIVFLLCIIPAFFVVTLTKDIMGFLNIKNNLLEKSRCQNVSILKDTGWFIKCADNF